ncbi:MAG: V-type ATP synthase subunit F [Thermoplasmata archaeon]|nr:V-type ATP synthase subunit F [Thermoplasmata archaeon]
MKIACIGDEDTVALLRLAGASHCVVADDVSRQFDELVKNEEVEILVINEKYAEKIRDKILSFMLLNDKPIIVEIPDKKGKIKERKEIIRKFIIRAVGVDAGE